MGIFGTIFGGGGSSDIHDNKGHVTHVEHSNGASFSGGNTMQTSDGTSTFGGKSITNSGNSYYINGQQYTRSGNTLYGPGGQAFTSGGPMTDQQARDIIFSQNIGNGNNGFNNGGF